MGKKTFMVGDRVGLNLAEEQHDKYDGSDPKLVKYYHRQYGDDPDYGTITSINGTKAQVDWDDYCFLGSKPVDIKHLLHEDEMKKYAAQLEEEFDGVAKELHSKMKEAAKIIKEADKIARKHGNKLAYVYDAIDPLYEAMNKAGWRTSSFGC